ncbi:hypothetical protein KRMM14A1259_18390 [Krasilnikovia sp. MM14-A1259]
MFRAGGLEPRTNPSGPDLAERAGPWPQLPPYQEASSARATKGVATNPTRSDPIRATKALAAACAPPFKRRRYRPKLSRRQKVVNRAHAKIRARGERAIATLKTWKILAKLRCCPRRASAIVQAILVLHCIESGRYAG